jgi:hypothetical protein
MKNKERIAALIAGISLIIMAISAGYSYGYIFGELFAENTLKSFENITNIQSLFLSGITGSDITLISLNKVFISVNISVNYSCKFHYYSF